MEKLVLPEKCVDEAEENNKRIKRVALKHLIEMNLAAEYMSTVNNPSMFPLEKK